MELLSALRLLWSLLCKEGNSIVNCRNHVDCKAMCGLVNGDMKYMNVLCVNSLFPQCAK